jgi:hypothetical protein
LHDSVQLNLIAFGTIKRIEPGRAEVAIGRYEFRSCDPAFFERPQPRQLPGRTAPGAGWLEFPQPVVTGGRIGRAISKNRRRPEVEGDDARWERVFKQKFDVPEYYGSRWPAHSSPTVDS